MEEDKRELCIKSTMFDNIVLNILGDCNKETNKDTGISLKALSLLQSITEKEMIKYFRESSKITEHRNDITLKVEDMRMASFYEPDGINDDDDIEEEIIDDDFDRFEEELNSIKPKYNHNYRDDML